MHTAHRFALCLVSISAITALVGCQTTIENTRPSTMRSRAQAVNHAPSPTCTTSGLGPEFEMVCGDGLSPDQRQEVDEDHIYDVKTHANGDVYVLRSHQDVASNGSRAALRLVLQRYASDGGVTTHIMPIVRKSGRIASKGRFGFMSMALSPNGDRVAITGRFVGGNTGSRDWLLALNGTGPSQNSDVPGGGTGFVAVFDGDLNYDSHIAWNVQESNNLKPATGRSVTFYDDDTLYISGVLRAHGTLGGACPTLQPPGSKHYAPILARLELSSSGLTCAEQHTFGYSDDHAPNIHVVADRDAERVYAAFEQRSPHFGKIDVMLFDAAGADTFGALLDTQVVESDWNDSFALSQLVLAPSPGKTGWRALLAARVEQNITTNTGSYSTPAAFANGDYALLSMRGSASGSNPQLAVAVLGRLSDRMDNTYDMSAKTVTLRGLTGFSDGGFAVAVGTSPTQDTHRQRLIWFNSGFEHVSTHELPTYTASPPAYASKGPIHIAAPQTSDPTTTDNTLAALHYEAAQPSGRLTVFTPLDTGAHLIVTAHFTVGPQEPGGQCLANMPPAGAKGVLSFRDPGNQGNAANGRIYLNTPLPPSGHDSHTPVLTVNGQRWQPRDHSTSHSAKIEMGNVKYLGFGGLFLNPTIPAGDQDAMRVLFSLARNNVVDFSVSEAATDTFPKDALFDVISPPSTYKPYFTAYGGSSPCKARGTIERIAFGVASHDEICDDGVDNNLNGAVDDGCP